MHFIGWGRFRKAERTCQVREGVQEISMACKLNAEAVAGGEQKVSVRKVCEVVLGRG